MEPFLPFRSREAPAPARLDSNGVPWLFWIGREGWVCEACGASGTFPEARTLAEFAHILGDLKRLHFLCRSPPDGNRRPGAGHVLNPDRAEL